MRITYFIILILFLCNIKVCADTFYSTYLNDFEYFSKDSITSINSQNLRVSNIHSDDYIKVDTFPIDGDYTFKYNVRLANLHNEEGKQYTYFDDSGKKKKIGSTEYGVVWNYLDNNNYYAVLLSCSNSNIYDEIHDKRTMNIKVVHVINNNIHILKELNLEKFVDLYQGFNLVRIAYDGETTTIYIGHKNLKIIAQLTDIDYSSSKRFGYIAKKGSCVEIERIVIQTSPILTNALMTSWTQNLIDEHINSSNDPYEGYWSYLDRKLDNKKIRIGGKYKIALIKNGKDYDIIYISGSKVNNQSWKCGMLKGKLIHTIFTDNFNLVWYDSMKKPFDDDEYANFENGNILTLHFPLHDGQIRLYKCPTTD